MSASANDNEHDAASLQVNIDAIREIQPIAPWNLTASAIAVVTSFAGPIIQAMMK
jgi:hypothetical protein